MSASWISGRPRALDLGIFSVFFLSGAAALVYQLIWQRVLFALYGLDTTSVTIVVTAFMLGLGVGSLVGGALSRAYPGAALPLFAAFELGIGAFGFFSLSIFEGVASFTTEVGHLGTGVAAFLLVLFPTTLMGATLPLLVGHATRKSRNVGRSVGNLYFVNTLGAALGSLMAARFLLGWVGLAFAVKLAAFLNAQLGLAVVALHRREGRRT